MKRYQPGVQLDGPPGSRRFRYAHRHGKSCGGGYPSSAAATAAAKRAEQHASLRAVLLRRTQVPQQQQEHSSAPAAHSKADGGTESERSPATEHPRPHAEAGDGLGEAPTGSGLERGRRVHAPGPAPSPRTELDDNGLDDYGRDFVAWLLSGPDARELQAAAAAAQELATQVYKALSPPSQRALTSFLLSHVHPQVVAELESAGCAKGERRTPWGLCVRDAGLLLRASEGKPRG